MKRRVMVMTVLGLVTGCIGCSGGEHASNSGGQGDDAVRLTIDGRPQAVAGPVSCSAHSGGFAIRAGTDPLDVFVRLIPFQTPLRVGSVDLGSFLGAPLSYRGKPDGSDVAEKDDVYTIRGDAVLQTTPPSTETKAFELVLTCP